MARAWVGEGPFGLDWGGRTWVLDPGEDVPGLRVPFGAGGVGPLLGLEELLALGWVYTDALRQPDGR